MELMGLFLFTQLYRLNPTSRVDARLSGVGARLYALMRDFTPWCATFGHWCAPFGHWCATFGRWCATFRIGVGLHALVRDFPRLRATFGGWLGKISYGRCIGLLKFSN